jgi:hypothetical protein
MQLLLNSAIWVALIALIPVFASKVYEKHSTNKAILAEIYRLLRVVAAHRDFWQRCVEDGSTDRRPFIPFAYRIYSNQIQNIGVIRPGIVAKVVEFYGDIDFINAYQALKDPAVESGHLDEFNTAYIRFLSSILKQFEPAFKEEFKRLGIGPR